MSVDPRSGRSQSDTIDAPRYSGPEDFVLWEFVAGKAGAFPDRIAVTQDDVDFTWRDLNVASDRLATFLSELGVGPGDRVAHLDGNTVVALELLFAVSKLGAVMIPLNWRLSVPELSALLNDMAPKAVLCGARFAAAGQELRMVSDDAWDLTVYSDDGAVPWAECGPIPGYHRGEPRGTVLQLCTSGTTGTPRGVELTNLSLHPHITGIASIWHFSSETVTLVAMPLFHVSGLGWFLASLSANGRAILARQAVADELLDLMERYAVTNVLLVPTVVRTVCTAAAASRGDWSSLEVLVYGGSPMPADTLRLARTTFGCKTIEVYGMSETAGAFSGRETTFDDTGADVAEPAPVGRMYPWMQVRICDLDTGRPVTEHGVVGEIEVCGPQLMSGYFANPAATAAVFDGDWLHTGDAGYLDTGGRLYLVGRVKEMIISGGENIYPAEIENVLTLHGSVDEAAIVGMPDSQWGEVAVAFVVAVPGSDTATLAEELRGFARARLAGFKIPKDIRFVESLPKNPSGKVLKRNIKVDSPQNSAQEDAQKPDNTAPTT